jgi:FixJ family two-component response regulator
MSAEFVRDALFRRSVTTRGAGSGIGAWQARELLRGCGGDLDVESHPGAGTTMRLRLPHSLGQGPMSKPKLLVIEDDAALSAQYRWLSPIAACCLAADRRQALMLAERRASPRPPCSTSASRPDAEGVTEGFATLDGLRSVSRGTLVIVVSGQGQRENMLRAVAQGAYDFCEKPVDLAALRTILDRALRLRELEVRIAASPSSRRPARSRTSSRLMRACFASAARWNASPSSPCPSCCWARAALARS